MSEFTHRLPHQPWPKPSRNEDHYFHREEFRQRMEAARHREARREMEDRKRWLAEHEGHCPGCGGVLEPIDTGDGSAQQCPNCLGVWLDHETFDRLTHPHEKNEYLTGILREMLLEWTTGRKPRQGGAAPAGDD
jgi:Zn-finger nucleic acid-binding protein